MEKETMKNIWNKSNANVVFDGKLTMNGVCGMRLIVHCHGGLPQVIPSPGHIKTSIVGGCLI